ncbi:MAG: hypothetical protein U1A27_07160 [Phycisphaerae bacterium]
MAVAAPAGDGVAAGPVAPGDFLRGRRRFDGGAVALGLVEGPVFGLAERFDKGQADEAAVDGDAQLDFDEQAGLVEHAEMQRAVAGAIAGPVAGAGTAERREAIGRGGLRGGSVGAGRRKRRGGAGHQERGERGQRGERDGGRPWPGRLRAPIEAAPGGRQGLYSQR